MNAHVDLKAFQQHVKLKSPAFVPLFKDQSRYQVVWGGAGSGKSHIVARKILYRLLNESHVKHNFLIARKVGSTIKKSCWKLLLDIIIKWGLYDDFDINKTEFTMIYRPTGSMIIFSGLDDEQKLKSIEGVTGIWFEEASEGEQVDFEQLDLRLRGNHGCHLQIILTFNPISDQHWLKRVFFDDPIESVFTLKTTYLDNQFIDDAYKLVMDNKKKTNPRYYNIYCLGNWGTSEGLIFNNVKIRPIRDAYIEGLDCVQGLDFGYTNDPSAFNQTYIDVDKRKLYVFEGFYEKGLSNYAISKKLKDLNAHRHMTTCDSAEPKSIDSLKGKGCRVRGAMKGKDSINTGVDFLLEFEIVLNSHLVEFKTEFDNYCWAVDKSGKATNKPVDDWNHFIDSLRYAVEHYYIKQKRQRFAIHG